MSNKTRVLIGDNSCEFGMLLSKYLNKSGFETFCRRCNYSIIKESVIEEKPDAVIICAYTPDASSPSLISEISARLPDIKIIAVSYISLPKFYSALIKAGADRCILMPASMHDIRVLLSEVVKPASAFSFESEVSAFLVSKGIPQHLSGFRYLCTCVCLCIVNTEYIADITDGLYKKVAEIHKTEPQLVERSLRHISKLIAENGSEKNLICGGNVVPEESGWALTNYELICAAADSFAAEYKLFDTSIN